MSIQFVPSVWNTIARHFLFSLGFKACLRVVAASRVFCAVFLGL